METFLVAAPVFYLVVIIVTLVLCGRILFTSRTFASFGVANIFLLLFELLFTIIAPAIGFMRFDQYGPDIPFSKLEVDSVIMIVVFSSACFWVARLFGEKLRGFLRHVIGGGIMLGVLLCFFTTIHFGGYNLNGIAFPLLGFELLSPFICVFILLKQLVLLFADPELRLAEEKEISSLDTPIKESTHVLRKDTWRHIAASLAPGVILLILFIAFDTVIGLGYDSIFKAYTDSVGFVFSN